MKIAFDAKRFFQNRSGLGNYSRDLVRMLSDFYPENQYLLLNEKETDLGAEIAERKFVSFVPLAGSFLVRQRTMGLAEQEQKAEVFHGLSGELPWHWNKQPIKKIVTIHDLIFVRFPQYYSFFDRKIHFWKFKKACLAADQIIAISEQTKQDIVEFLKIPAAKISVVYQGCHQAFKIKYSREHLEEIRKKYELPARFILNVGTIEKRKNTLNILKAIKGTDIPLVIVGRKTKYFKKIQTFSKKNKLSNQLYFPENVPMEDLACLYQLADIFVYPSFFEGFGIPVIEALFSGTATITSNISSLPEAGGPAALYVHPQNPEDLKSKILFLWNNPAERKRREEIGLEYVKKFEDRAVSENLRTVYQEVIARD